MEDEECLPENGDLSVYLKNLGYSDVSTNKKLMTTENPLNFEMRNSVPEKHVAGWLDKDIVEQIEMLLSTKMLFEEDVSNVEKLLSNFKIMKTGLLKSIFQSYSTAFIIIFGVCFYWIIGNYIFALISVFYAYHASDYLWKKHYSQDRIKNLMTALKANYMVLKKTLQFIKENDNLLQQNFFGRDKDTENGFEFFENLRKEFFISEYELIKVLSKATKSLVNDVPLYDHIENPQYYLCNKYSQSFSDITDLTKLHQVYLLVQSEFLQRVALSLIPNLQKNSKDNYRDIIKIFSRTTNTLVKLESKLSKKFKFVFLNGIHFNSQKSELKMPSSFEPQSKYAVEFISNIHDTSNTLQSLLIKSRIIENEFSCEKFPKQVEDELASIQNDLVTCQKNISDSVILFKKLNINPNDSSKLKTIEEENKEIENNYNNQGNAITVGYTDLDPKVDDEVFEVYLNNEDKKEKYLDEDYDFEDKLKKKLEKEYSKNVLKELKSRLVETAKKREAREENALKRKLTPNAAENVSKFDKEKQNEEIKAPLDTSKTENSINLQDTCSFKSLRDEFGIMDLETESAWPLPRFKRCGIIRKNNRIISFRSQKSEDDDHKEIVTMHHGSSEQLPKNDFNFSDSQRLENSVNLINTNFLSSINQARSKIFAAEFQEETFCDTGENLEDEEDILKSYLVQESDSKKTK